MVRHAKYTKSEHIRIAHCEGSGYCYLYASIPQQITPPSHLTSWIMLTKKIGYLPKASQCGRQVDYSVPARSATALQAGWIFTRRVFFWGIKAVLWENRWIFPLG